MAICATCRYIMNNNCCLVCFRACSLSVCLYALRYVLIGSFLGVIYFVWFRFHYSPWCDGNPLFTEWAIPFCVGVGGLGYEGLVLPAYRTRDCVYEAGRDGVSFCCAATQRVAAPAAGVLPATYAAPKRMRCLPRNCRLRILARWPYRLPLQRCRAAGTTCGRHLMPGCSIAPPLAGLLPWTHLAPFNHVFTVTCCAARAVLSWMRSLPLAPVDLLRRSGAPPGRSGFIPCERRQDGLLWITRFAVFCTGHSMTFRFFLLPSLPSGFATVLLRALAMPVGPSPRRTRA